MGGAATPLVAGADARRLRATQPPSRCGDLARHRRAGSPAPAGPSPANRPSPCRRAHCGAARRPSLRRDGPVPSSRTGLPPASGPGAGRCPGRTSWSCGSPTASTSPRSSSSTGRAVPGTPRQTSAAVRSCDVLTGFQPGNGFRAWAAVRRHPAGPRPGEGDCGSMRPPRSGPSTRPPAPPSPTSRTFPRSRPDDGVAALVPSRAGGPAARPGRTAAGTEAKPTWPARMERGLGRILELLAP